MIRKKGMYIKSSRNERKPHGQAMVEFALVLPILLLIIYGLLEVGRLLFIYASVTTASRQAVRYASATGDNDTGTPRFKDCSGITASANSVAFIVNFDTVNITYDRPDPDDPNNINSIRGMNIDPSVANECPTLAAMTDDVIQNGDRVKVFVDAQYTPIVPLVPLDPFTIRAESSRTVIVFVSIQVTAPPAAWEPSTSTATLIPTNTPTDTPTPTYTPTDTPTPVFTFTPSNTPTITSTPSATPTPSDTPTPSNTPTATETPTVTPTAIINCDSTTVWSSNFNIPANSNTMSMNITNNTTYVLDISQIFVAWNTSGAAGGGELRLTAGNLGGTFWSDPIGESNSPKVFGPGPTIPTGSSSISFTFHDIYTILNGTETIVVTIGTNGCNGLTLTGN